MTQMSLSLLFLLFLLSTEIVVNNKQKVGGEDEGDSRHQSGEFNHHPTVGSPFNVGLVESPSLFSSHNGRGHVDRTQMYQSMNGREQRKI